MATEPYQGVGPGIPLATTGSVNIPRTQQQREMDEFRAEVRSLLGRLETRLQMI
jgi:hypothetical protein